MAYQPFIGKTVPGQLPVKPVINPLVKQMASKPMGPTQPSQPTQMQKSNPAMAWSSTGGVTRGSTTQIDTRPVGASGIGGIQTVQGPTSADLHKQTVEERLAADTAAGYANADKYGIGAEGSMGRLNDERKAEIDELLAKQKAGMDGMTPQEMQAAREQGVSGINGQLSTNLSMLGDIAAGNGVRGGSAVGLQMGALNQAQTASGALSRQLILDNIAQKNIAMDRYGNTLQTQQGVGLGIQDSNNQSANAEKLARELAAGNYSSTIDSYRSGDKADGFTQQGLDIMKDQVDFLKNQGRDKLPVDGKGTTTGKSASGSTTTTTGPGKQGVDVNNLGPNQTAKKNENGSTTITTINPDGSNTTETVNSPPMEPNAKAEAEVKYAIASGATASVNEAGKVVLTMPDGRKFTTDYSESDYATVANKMDQEKADRAAAEAEAQRQYDEEHKNDKIICTEAYRQGLISREKWLVTGRYRALLTMTEYKGYLTWAQPVVARMKADSKFAAAIAPFIRRMIEGERYALGEIDSLTLGERAVATLVKVANYTGAFVRSMRLKAKARQAAQLSA